jgi:two-component system, chemotaxis family, sensor kinase CheA
LIVAALGFLKRFNMIFKGTFNFPMSNFSNESVKEFLSEGLEISSRVTTLLSSLDQDGLGQDQLDALYRDMHTLKGSAQLFGFKQIGLLAHAAEACLEPVRQGRLKLDDDFIDEILKIIDLIERILKDPSKDTAPDEALVRELNHLIPRLADLTAEKLAGIEWTLAKDHLLEEAVPEKPQQPAVPTPIVEKEVAAMKQQPEEAKVEKAPTSPDSAENSSIRVQVSLLDRLMNLVGELVLVRNQVTQHAKTSEDGAYIQLTQRLDVVTSELQDQAMRTRMQPVGLVFAKFQRIVRDISRDLGKKIDLRIEGAETELDKSIIEAIKDPLTHIVRNSCDHGIEKPEDRRNSGKNEMGTLIFNAYQEGGQVVIEISDDGQGIDPARVKGQGFTKRASFRNPTQCHERPADSRADIYGRVFNRRICNIRLGSRRWHGCRAHKY